MNNRAALFRANSTEKRTRTPGLAYVTELEDNFTKREPVSKRPKLNMVDHSSCTGKLKYTRLAPGIPQSTDQEACAE